MANKTPLEPFTVVERQEREKRRNAPALLVQQINFVYRPNAALTSTAIVYDTITAKKVKIPFSELPSSWSMEDLVKTGGEEGVNELYYVKLLNRMKETLRPSILRDINTTARDNPQKSRLLQRIDLDRDMTVQNTTITISCENLNYSYAWNNHLWQCRMWVSFDARTTPLQRLIEFYKGWHPDYDGDDKRDAYTMGYDDLSHAILYDRKKQWRLNKVE